MVQPDLLKGIGVKHRKTGMLLKVRNKEQQTGHAKFPTMLTIAIMIYTSFLFKKNGGNQQYVLLITFDFSIANLLRGI